MAETALDPNLVSIIPAGEGDDQVFVDWVAALLLDLSEEQTDEVQN